MADLFSPPASESRLLLDVPLKPRQGDRFQPTGFPDLGPARYKASQGDGTVEVVLIESAQSMANHLESMVFDPPPAPRQPDPSASLAKCLAGLPYVRVDRPDGALLTNSLLEAHRLNSPYILRADDAGFFKILKAEIDSYGEGPVNLRAFAKLIFRYDPNSVLHGVFLAEKELAGGRYRLPRVLSAFIEAKQAQPADYGGVKVNAIDPKGLPGLDGSGNVIYHRTDFTGQITAYFNLDLALLRGYRLGEPAERFLVALALYKVRRFLTHGLRLRTACDLMPTHIGNLPDEQTIADAVEAGLADCHKGGLFIDPAVTVVRYGKKEDAPAPSATPSRPRTRSKKNT